jgi:PAS domain S-box-containing protein
VGAKVGFALTLPPQAVSTLWPPNAILLGALLITPMRSWWVVLLAAFPAHLAAELGSGVPPLMVLCWFASNCSEALIGAACVRLVRAEPLRLDSFRRVALFGLAAFLAVFLSSFLDIAFVMLNRWGNGRFWDMWRIRFFSNMLAALTLVPVIVAVGTGALTRLRTASARRYVEGGFLAAGLVSVCVFVFAAGPRATPALLYAPLPLLLWAAVRFGAPGTSVGVLLVALFAIWGAIHGHGPFVSSSAAENALAMQLFVIVISVPLMTLAAVIEERGRAEEAARRSEERLELALDAAQLGTLDWAIAGDRLSWSPKSREILGLLPDDRDHTLDRFLSLLSDEDRSGLTREVARAIEQCDGYDSEFRVSAPKGEVRWVMSKGRAQCDREGQPVRMVGVVADITDRKRAQEQAQARRSELAHVSRTALLCELAAAIAHEVNQPLAAILANARAAQRLLVSERPDLGELRDILEDITQDDRRAGDVIHRLYALMKRSELQPRRLDLNEVVTDILGMVEGDLVGRAVSVDLRLAPSLPVVIADPVQLQQVVYHLIVNACEAMSGQGGGDRRVTITTTRTPEGAAQLSVTDPGTGISPDQLDHVFRPFVTSKPQRPGLGLAICRSIVRAHGGRLWAVNNPDRGATFHVVLPPAVAEVTGVAAS